MGSQPEVNASCTTYHTNDWEVKFSGTEEEVDSGKISKSTCGIVLCGRVFNGVFVLSDPGEGPTDS